MASRVSNFQNWKAHLVVDINSKYVNFSQWLTKHTKYIMPFLMLVYKLEFWLGKAQMVLRISTTYFRPMAHFQ